MVMLSSLEKCNVALVETSKRTVEVTHLSIPSRGLWTRLTAVVPFFSYRYSVNLAVIRKEHSNSVDRYSRKNRREPITKPNLKSNVAVEGKGQISAFQTQ